MQPRARDCRSEKMDSNEKYKSEMLRAMEKCQFIEETLKMCILSSIDITRHMTQAYFPLNYQMKDITKLPMGPLVNKFSKINSDSVLIQKLRDITKDRNFVAHQSLLFTLGELGDDQAMLKATEKITSIANNAHEIHQCLLDERYRLERARVKVFQRDPS